MTKRHIRAFNLEKMQETAAKLNALTFDLAELATLYKDLPEDITSDEYISFAHLMQSHHLAESVKEKCMNMASDIITLQVTVIEQLLKCDEYEII